MDTAELFNPSGFAPKINGLPYLRFLGRLHQALQPNWYLEIGTFRGRSLEKVDCNFVAVDPNFRLKNTISKPSASQMHLMQMTSDLFFKSGFAEKNEMRFDLAFLDGLHHFECLLRDFINTEPLMSENGVVTLHDCCPLNSEMTVREYKTGAAWTGDVWKTLTILLQERPDLNIQVASAAPTGLVVINNLDPKNTTLRDNYDALVEKFMNMSLGDFENGFEGFYDQFELIDPQNVLHGLGIS